jgi:hypothetical protein
MKQRFVYVCWMFIFSLALIQPNQVKADTVKLYPENDGVAQMYDEDQFTDWDEARNYTGLITRDAAQEGVGNNVGNTGVKSDKFFKGVYRIYRVSKTFDLSQLPEGAEITSARLNLYRTVANAEGDVGVVVTSHSRENINQMEKQDWNIVNFGEVAFAQNKIDTSGYNEFSFNQEGLTYLENKIGEVSTIGLLTEFDFNDIEPPLLPYAAGWREVNSIGTEFDPYLEITFEVPDEPTDEYPLYTQVESIYPSIEATAGWADDIYAGGDDYWCGTSIGECGCVLASMTMAARNQGITEGVDGTTVDPKNFNAWLQDNEGYTSGGSIIWARAADYFGELRSGMIETPLKFITNRANAAQIDEAVVASDSFAIGFNESKGHYFVLSDVLVGGYEVKDPFWYNTQTTNDAKDSAGSVQDYNDVVTYATVYDVVSPQTPTGLLEIIANSPVELLIVNEVGEMTGSLEGDLVENIPSSWYTDDSYIANQFAQPEGRMPEHFEKRLTNTKASGEYTLTAKGTDSGVYTLTFEIRTPEGERKAVEIVASTTLGQIDTFTINIETGEVTSDNDQSVKLDREAFITILKLATVDEHRGIQRFLLRHANNIFDAYEAGKIKQAEIKLRIFKKLVRLVRVRDTELTQAMKDLRTDLKEQE